MDSAQRSFVLLLVGVALLVNPFVPGVHVGSGAVYEYEAATVEYAAGEGFQLRYVRTGQRLESVPVDDQIVCEDDREWRRCALEFFVQQNGGVPAYASAGLQYPGRYELVLLGDRLYEPVTVERGDSAYLSLDPVNDSDPLRRVARTDLSRVERRAVESGRVVTYRNLPRTDQLLRVSGDYYVVRQTARKRYTWGRDNCFSSGEGFCSAADWKRWTDTALTLATRLAGLLLVVREWNEVRE